MNVRIMQELHARNLKYLNDMAFGDTVLEADTVKRMFVNEGGRFTLKIGEVDITDGRLWAGDMSYMSHGQHTPAYGGLKDCKGAAVEIAGFRSSCCGLRICALRVKLKDTEAVRYVIAEPTPETVVLKCSDGDLFGFPVDAGMIMLAGTDAAIAMVKFTKEWEEVRKEENIYDGYLSLLLKDSAKKLSEFQREGGDFAVIPVPDTEHRAVICASGYGDGFYNCFKGFDGSEEVCELVIPFIDEDRLEKRDKQYLELWDGEPMCLVTNHVAEGGKVTYMLREEPFPKIPDSGWRFYGENEDEDYWDDPENYTFADIHDVAERQPEMIPLLRSPEESSFALSEDGGFIPDTENR